MKRDYDYYDVKTRHEYQRAYQRKKMSELKDRMGGKCAFCGWNKVPEVLEFAHRHGVEKGFCIANLLRHNKTLLEAELGKCVLLCPTCHRIYDLERRKDGGLKRPENADSE
jgi:hypothetical protein